MTVRRTVMLETTVVVAAVVVVKLAVHAARFEVLEQNALFTSLIAGAIFLFGIILSGTLSDYKESEKMPSEFVAALESILAEVRATAQKTPAFDPSAALLVLAAIPQRLVEAATTGDYHPARQAIRDLSPVLDEMEAKGALPQYVSRARSDQSTLMRITLRISHMQ